MARRFQKRFFKEIFTRGRWVIAGLLGVLMAAIYMFTPNGPADYAKEYRLLTEKMKESAHRLGSCKGVTAKLEAQRPPAGAPLGQWIEKSSAEYFVAVFLVGSVGKDLSDVKKRLNKASRPPKELAEGRQLLREMLDELEKIVSLISTRDEGGMTCTYFRGTDSEFHTSMRACHEKFMQLDRMLPRTSPSPEE